METGIALYITLDVHLETVEEVVPTSRQIVPTEDPLQELKINPKIDLNYCQDQMVLTNIQNQWSAIA